MKTLSEKPKIIFNIAGGFGKNIAASAVVRLLSEKYPHHSMIVTSPYKDAWANNPYVEKVVDLEKTPEFFETYLKSGENILFLQDPYNTEDFVYKRKHLIEIWCDICGIKYDGSMPQLFFTEKEREKVKAALPQDKPLFIIQTSGGYINQSYPISWARDLPLGTAQEIVNRMRNEGYEVIHIRRENQYGLEGAIRPPLDSLREFLCALQFTDRRLLIDSAPEHAAAALALSSTVVWIVNSPNVFGYKMHHNILPQIEEKFRHNPDAYLDRYNIWGTLHEHPYDTDQIFNVEEIIKTLLE
ncbi:MAG TPA: hypothetical protein VFA52_02740 [Candidatus Paceibacterota bacterium]|nr:hypothetical protein [Candidatus Paceibacterota bacterium]